MTHLSWREW